MKRTVNIQYFFLGIFLPLIFLLGGCTPDSDAKLTVTRYSFDISGSGQGVLSFSVENRGEMPAFNVIIMADALKNGESLGYREKGIGTMFEDEIHTDTLYFDYFGFIEPDSINIRMTYTPYHAR